MNVYYPSQPGIATASVRRRGFFLPGLVLALLLGCALTGRPAWGQQVPGVPVTPPPGPGFAQAPAGGAEAPAGAPIRNPFGEMSLRIHWVMLEQYSFVLHPLYQITGDPGFQNGKAGSTFFYDVGTRDTDQNSNFLLKAMHALPPFGVEGVSPLGVRFLGGIGIGYDHYYFNLRDVEAAKGVSSVIPINADVYIQNATLRLYLFNPDEPGANFFFGVGVGALTGNIEAAPYAGQEPEYIDFSMTPMGTVRYGLESKGENWGFRYELVVVSANEVTLGGANPYPGSSAGVIDFSGTIVRLNLFVQL